MTIGGALESAVLRPLHFVRLSRDEQEAAIRCLAVSGQGLHSIAAATGLTVEVKLGVLAEESPI